MATVSVKKLASELTQLGAERGQLESEPGRRALVEALASQNGPLSAQAAKLVGEHKLEGLELALRTAFRGLLGPKGLSTDPGCLAKEALVITLETLEDTDAELFAEAALCVQLERAKGGARDTAVRVRARGVLGLARLGHPDFACILGACLADADPQVRLTAARAVAHRADRQGAGLLLLRLGAGDDTPDVLQECLRGLFVLAPDLALRQARAALRDAGERREQTLHALGTAADDSAISLLAEELEQQSLAEERRPVIEALGLSVRPSARSLLLELVRGDRMSDAEAALVALAIHRYDTRLGAQLAELTAHSRELTRRVRELFSA
jgi:hypothetical protein